MATVAFVAMCTLLESYKWREERTEWQTQLLREIYKVDFYVQLDLKLHPIQGSLVCHWCFLYVGGLEKYRIEHSFSIFRCLQINALDPSISLLEGNSFNQFLIWHPTQKDSLDFVTSTSLRWCSFDWLSSHLRMGCLFFSQIWCVKTPLVSPVVLHLQSTAPAEQQ